ncbi:hypothetical protein ABEW22_18735 [Bacillus velezensis]|uniref:hypothetical protein n=1 Tax=Bacillus velezensis TaxID=492670 RepID=UPI00345573D2
MFGFTLSVNTNPGILDQNFSPHFSFFNPGDFAQEIDFYSPHADNLKLEDADIAYARLKSIFNLVRGVLKILGYPPVWEYGKLNYDNGTQWSKPAWKEDAIISHIEKVNPFDRDITLKLSEEKTNGGRVGAYFQLIVENSHIRDVMNLYIDAIDNESFLYINATKIYETIITDLGIKGKRQKEQLNSLGIPETLRSSLNKIESLKKLMNNDAGIFYKRHGHNPKNNENSFEEEFAQLKNIKNDISLLVNEWFKYNVTQK